MLTRAMSGAIVILFYFIGSSLCSDSNSTGKNLVPLMLKMTTAQDLYSNGKHEETLESMHEILKTFKSEFGEDPDALTVLSHLNIGDSNARISLSTVQSRDKPEKLFHHLLYTVAREIFGPTSDNTLIILLHLGFKLLKDDQLDKALQAEKALAKILTTSLDPNSKSKSNSTWTKEKRVEMLLGVLQNVCTIHLKLCQWPQAAATYTTIYETQIRHGMGSQPIGESKKKLLETLVEKFEFVTRHKIKTLMATMFNLVNVFWKVEDMTQLDYNKHFSAYEVSYMTTAFVPHESFQMYKHFLQLEVAAVDEEMGQVQFNSDTPPNKMVPLKFDEDVNEALFSSHRLIASTEKMAEKDSDYSKYKRMAKYNGENDEQLETVLSMSENYAHNAARTNQNEAKKRIKDIMKRTEDKFGKDHYKTKGAAQIFVALYKIVGVDKEAWNLRTRFGIQEEDIIEKIIASKKDANIRDEL